MPDPRSPADAPPDAHRGYHDLGGLEDGPVVQSDHVLEPWEKRVDAMRMLLGDRKRQIMRADGLRGAIESMGEDLYLELSYYERWMAAMIKVLTDRGVLERDAIEARMQEVIERLGLEELEPRPMPPRPKTD